MGTTARVRNRKLLNSYYAEPSSSQMVTSRAADPANSENSYIKSPHQSWFLDFDESFSNPTRLFMALRLEGFFRSFRATRFLLPVPRVPPSLHPGRSPVTASRLRIATPLDTCLTSHRSAFPALPPFQNSVR